MGSHGGPCQARARVEDVRVPVSSERRAIAVASCSWVIGAGNGELQRRQRPTSVPSPPHRPALHGLGTAPHIPARCRAAGTDGQRRGPGPPGQAVPAIGLGRRQNPSDRASAQASRPPSPPSRSHWTPHRARDVAMVARKTAPLGRPLTTATHRHESSTGGRIGTALATSTAVTRVDDTLLRHRHSASRRDRYALRLLHEDET